MHKDTKRNFNKEGIKMENKHLKWYSASLAFKEMQIKTTISSHYTPIRMAKIKR